MKRYSHVCKLEKQMDLILQSQNPIFSPRIRGEKPKFLGAIVGIRDPGVYIGPWALVENVEWSKDR